MSGFISILESMWNLLTLPMNIYGFTFSFWDIAIFSTAACIIVRFIGYLIYG